MKAGLFSSQTRAFSFLEILIVLSILAIFILMALPKIQIGKKPCIYELRAKLATANAEFLDLYKRHITQQLPIETRSILDRLVLPMNPQCYFSYHQKLVAHIYGERLIFNLSPQDFSTRPKIYCSLSSALCREFWGKTLKK